MANPNWLVVDVEAYLRDCPPEDVSIPEEKIKDIAHEIVNNFDYTSVYDAVDRLACSILRDKGLLK
jgi:hypothetical protein